MKKSLLMLMVFGIAGSLALQAAPVNSVNVVGYVSATNAANTWYIRSGPFAKIGSGAAEVTIGDILGTNVANGTIVYLWNGSTYVPESFAAGAWGPGTNLISRADGFWMRSTSGFQLTRLGEVPYDAYASNTVTVISPGLQLVAYPYPVAMDLTNMSFNAIAANGDTIFKGNGVTWDTTSFAAGAWGTNFLFQVGEGCWYKRSGSSSVTNWTVVKPYTLQ